MTTSERIEHIILKNLIFNEEYTRRVIPYLKEYLFENEFEREVFLVIKEFLSKYNNLPTRKGISVELEKKNLKQTVYDSCIVLLKKLKRSEEDNDDQKWLIDRTEDFCQEKEIAYALTKSIEIIDDPKQKGNRGEITKLLQEALGVSFDPNIGHDYFDEAEEAYEHYTREEEKLAFDIDLLNRATLGGVTKGTLNVIIAATGVGKSLAMCHLASAYLMSGKNVLYITLEMGRFEIRRRIDANNFDVEMNDIKKLKKADFLSKIRDIRSRTRGAFKVKQYPTAAASVLHFRHLLDDLRLKQKFVPDVILIDYLNICSSSRIKASANAGSFAYMKAIAEEFRGLAVEFNLPVWTATQTNREGSKSSDVDLSDTSESFGIPFTADFMLALMATKETDKFQAKILKNRYNDIHEITRFLIGVDRKKMRLFDVDNSKDFDISVAGDEGEDFEMTGSTNHLSVVKKVTKASVKDTIKKMGAKGKLVQG